MSNLSRIETLLGDKAQSLLSHVSNTVSKEHLHAPGPDFVERIFGVSNRNIQTLRSLQTILNHGFESFQNDLN